MKVKQHAYLSPAALKLRKRDGTKPWQVHPSECDDLKHANAAPHAFHLEWLEACRLREELERE